MGHGFVYPSLYDHGTQLTFLDNPNETRRIEGVNSNDMHPNGSFC